MALKLWYSMRELTREIGLISKNCPKDEESAAAKKLRRTLHEGGVDPRPDGRVWICDIRQQMPYFLDSWEEKMHYEEIGRKFRPRLQVEEDYG